MLASTGFTDVIRTAAAQTAEDDSVSAARFVKTAATTLAPVYPALADWLVDRYQLARKTGTGLDIGGGPGRLVIELGARTERMRWITVDINPYFIPYFRDAATAAGVADRVEIHTADVQALPFSDDHFDFIVSRGSFLFWPDQEKAFAELYRALKPGGTAFIGRGFSENLPVDVARNIRTAHQPPAYEKDATAAALTALMQTLRITDFRIHRPAPTGSEGVNYGIWLEFHKPEAVLQGTPLIPSGMAISAGQREYAADTVHITDFRWRNLIEKPILESPALEPALTTVTKEDIAKQGAKTLIDALEYVPGAWVETRGRKVKQFFSIRGQKYPYPEYSIAGTWQREFHEMPFFFSSSDIERIEIIRSSAALLTGLSGITGIINVIPREYTHPETSVELEHGSYDGYRTHFSHGAARSKGAYAFAFGTTHTDGPLGRNADESMWTMRGSGRWTPCAGLSLETNIFHLDGEQSLASALPPAAAQYQNITSEFDPIHALLASGKIHRTWNNKTSTELIWQIADRDIRYIGNQNSPATTSNTEDEREWGVNLTHAVSLSSSNILRVGGLYNHWVAPNGKRFYVGRRTDLATWSGVIVDEHRFGSFVLDGGLRWAKTKINEYGAFNIEGGANQFRNVEPIVDVWEPSIINTTLGIAWQVDNSVSLHLNTAFGQVRPYTGALTSDMEEPRNEQRYKLDLGVICQNAGAGKAALTGFLMYQDDAIALTGQTVTQNDRIQEVYTNRDQMQAGIEFDGRLAPIGGVISPFVNAVAMASRADINGDMIRNRETPKYIASGGFYTAKRALDFTLLWKYVSWYESARFAANNTMVSIGDYVTLNSTIGWTIDRPLQTRLYLELRNLTNQHYSTVVGYPDFGRRYTGGVRLTF